MPFLIEHEKIIILKLPETFVSNCKLFILVNPLRCITFIWLSIFDARTTTPTREIYLWVLGGIFVADCKWNSYADRVSRAKKREDPYHLWWQSFYLSPPRRILVWPVSIRFDELWVPKQHKWNKISIKTKLNPEWSRGRKRRRSSSRGGTAMRLWWDWQINSRSSGGGIVSLAISPMADSR